MGEIVWDGFSATPIDQRQQMVWNQLRDVLGGGSQGVGILVLNTQSEHDAV